LPSSSCWDDPSWRLVTVKFMLERESIDEGARGPELDPNLPLHQYFEQQALTRYIEEKLVTKFATPATTNIPFEWDDTLNSPMTIVPNRDSREAEYWTPHHSWFFRTHVDTVAKTKMWGKVDPNERDPKRKQDMWLKRLFQTVLKQSPVAQASAPLSAEKFFLDALNIAEDDGGRKKIITKDAAEWTTDVVGRWDGKSTKLPQGTYPCEWIGAMELTRDDRQP